MPKRKPEKVLDYEETVNFLVKHPHIDKSILFVLGSIGMSMMAIIFNNIIFLMLSNLMCLIAWIIAVKAYQKIIKYVKKLLKHSR